MREFKFVQEIVRDKPFFGLKKKENVIGSVKSVDRYLFDIICKVIKGPDELSGFVVVEVNEIIFSRKRAYDVVVNVKIEIFPKNKVSVIKVKIKLVIGVQKILDFLIIVRKFVDEGGTI